jgi:hypothetical protein
MGKSSPPPPAAPNYAEATREGIYTDIETLPTRRLIEQAARMGETATYQDPETGEDRVADFTGFGDIDLTRKETDALLELVPQLSQAQLDNLLEYGPQFVEAQRDQLRQVAPDEFALREEFAQRMREGDTGAEDLMGEIPDVPEYGEVEAPTFEDTGRTAAGRAELEGRIFDRLSLGDKLSPDQQRALEQDVLKAASRRGQSLSGATALREVLAKFGGGEELGRQRRSEALGFLSSGQAGSDTTNRLAQANFANAMQQVQQGNQAKGATFAGQQQNLGQRLAARQQDVGNIQSLLGLQPLAAQAGQLSGLQQGASPFTMPQMQRGTVLDPNAAATSANFAGNVFGTQGDIWGTQARIAAQPSGVGQIFGTAFGALTGGIGEGLGAGLSKKWGPKPSITPY